MMNYKNHFIASLAGTYAESELQSMWRILVEDKLAAEGFANLNVIIQQLKECVPLQYLTGIQYFYDQKFHVNKHVLIPRPETEELIDWVLSEHDRTAKNVIDVGTGSGCIAIIIKSKRVAWNVHGMDLSKEALKIAEKNANVLNIDVNWHKGDMTIKSAYPIDADIIICNPPYVLESDLDMMSNSTKLYEPKLALFVEDHDPLKYYRALIEHTKGGIAKTYYFEIHHLLSDQMVQLCHSFGLKNIEVRNDMQGKQRMLRAYKPPILPNK